MAVRSKSEIAQMTDKLKRLIEESPETDPLGDPLQERYVTMLSVIENDMSRDDIEIQYAGNDLKTHDANSTVDWLRGQINTDDLFFEVGTGLDEELQKFNSVESIIEEYEEEDDDIYEEELWDELDDDDEF